MSHFLKFGDEKQSISQCMKYFRSLSINMKARLLTHFVAFNVYCPCCRLQIAIDEEWNGIHTMHALLQSASHSKKKNRHNRPRNPKSRSLLNE